MSAGAQLAVIRPVNFIFDARTQSVIFRSARGGKLTALLLTQRADTETTSTVSQPS